jgi:hypothetical protein
LSTRYLDGMRAPLRSKALWLAASILVVALTLLGLWLGREVTPGEESSRAERTGTRPSTPEPVRTEPPRPAPLAERAPDARDAGHEPPPEAPPPPSAEEPRQHPVDLAKLRERLPHNLYWQLGAPTEDPTVLRQREEETQRWNTLHGKVVSNTATEEEIHEYFEHRRAVSEDFIEFARTVLQEYGDQLPEQERGLYELSIRMHSTRLEEIPRQIDEALARKRLQDERRQKWREGQP